MGVKLTVRERENIDFEYEDDDDGYRRGQMSRYHGADMARGGRSVSMARYNDGVIPNRTTQDRYVTEERTTRTNDPMVKLSEVAASKGFNVPPVLIAAAGGAIAWGMFQQMVIAGAIAAGAYLFTSMNKGKPKEGG